MEGVHATLCTILSDAMEGGFLDHTPAWRTYHYTGKKKEKVIAGEATAQQLIAVLEEGNLKYETYFKLIIATGMRRGECCGLQWGDINWDERSIHIQQNVVKVTGEDIICLLYTSPSPRDRQNLGCRLLLEKKNSTPHCTTTTLSTPSAPPQVKCSINSF